MITFDFTGAKIIISFGKTIISCKEFHKIYQKKKKALSSLLMKGLL